MITEEIDYYKANREEFITLYNGKHLVIKDKQIIGVYNTNSQAYDETIKSHQVGTFIIERPFNLKKPKAFAV
ncbi:MAG: hypothetical protein EOP56_10680 [Sphingobacteriales bacterium]|nr:MAG: hypothetical protein EOP56_10680 [Sphingobacteriales bacterium]